MIVQCPSCGARYRINDENIPDSGGKIRCPSCSHAFIVYPEHSVDDDSTSVANEAQLSKLVSESSVLPTPEDDEADNAPTEMVASEELDKIRAFQELEKQFGAALDTDGTVEIENPMKAWMEAQRALEAKKNPPPPSEPSKPTVEVNLNQTPLTPPPLTPPVTPPPLTPPPPVQSEIVEASDAYEEAPTEIVSSATLDLAAINPSLSPFAQEDEEDIDPTEIVNVADVLEHLEQDEAETRDLSALPRNQIPAPSGLGSPPSGNFSIPSPSGNFPQAENPPTQSASGNFPQAQPPNFPPTYGEKPTNEWAAQDHQQLMAPSLGADPNFNGPWSLKTNFGLTYEFPDTKSLNNWLQSRDDVQGYSLSMDSVDFQPLAAFPQVMTRNAGASGSFNIHIPSTGPLADAINQLEPNADGLPPVGQQSLAPMQQTFQPNFNPNDPRGLAAEPSSGALVNNEYVLPSREGSPFVSAMWAVCLASGLMTLLIAVQVFDVYDIVGNFKTHVLGMSAPIKKPISVAPVKKPTTEVIDEPVVDPEVERARIEQIIKDAKREIKANRPKSAIEKLEKVIAVNPDRAEAYELMAVAHEELGAEEEAADARRKAEKLTIVSP